MTELEAGLYSIIVNYGLAAVILACITIFLIGVLKYFNVFAKVPKENRKPIYLVLNYVFVFALTAAYYGIFHISFADYVAYASIVGTAVNIIYPLYENLKIRELFKTLGNFIVNVVAKNKVAKKAEEIEKQKTKEIEVSKSAEQTTENSKNI